MSLKLNVGASKKVTDNNYGSRGASINLEVKIDSALVAEPVKLQERIRKLYGLIRISLAEELNGNGHAPASQGAAKAAAARPNRNGAAPRPVTAAQVKAIVAIALQRRLDLGPLLQERFQIEKPESLTLKQASELIGSLKSAGE